MVLTPFGNFNLAQSTCCCGWKGTPHNPEHDLKLSMLYGMTAMAHEDAFNTLDRLGVKVVKGLNFKHG